MHLSSKVYIVNWNQVTNLSQYEWEFLKYWNVSQCNSVLMFWLDSPWPIQCLLKSPIEWIIWGGRYPTQCLPPATYTHCTCTAWWKVPNYTHAHKRTERTANQNHSMSNALDACCLVVLYSLNWHVCAFLRTLFWLPFSWQTHLYWTT